MTRHRSLIGLALAASLAGCGSSSHGNDDAGGGGGDGSRPRDGGGGTRDGGRDAGRPRDGGRVPRPDSGSGERDSGLMIRDTGPMEDAAAWAGVTCDTPPPEGSESPPPFPTYDGTCPTLVSGHNLIRSTTSMRDFIVVLPTTMAPGERYPLFFLWHWLGGSSDDFYERGEVQAAVDAQRFIAVIPEEKGDLTFKWPYLAGDSRARVDEELRFFDDMLACVSAQFAVNEQCVTSVGVSAGALWTDQLAGTRGQHLSSIISLSGGTNGVATREWMSSSHQMPAVVLWGGPDDWCFVDFDAASRDLEAHLEAEGHFFVECVHNCTHAEPPLKGGSSRFSAMWQFVLHHPYWLPARASPYLATGLPSEYPEWCGIGAGSATIREGDCPGSSCM